MATTLRRLPLQVTLGALLFYGVTVSHGVTASSLALTSKVAGWDWLPMTSHPLLWLLTLPIRLLPSAWLPLGLNLFSAVGGAVTLGLLARSLELLPWCRPLATLKQRVAILPLLLAVFVAGLGKNFWQEATAATAETLDLLLLAACIWLVLEYRRSKDNRWLKAAAFVWGAGMAENWVMQMTLPLFVGSLVWLGRGRFLNRQWILPLAGLGLAGFAIYVVLPLVNGLPAGSVWSSRQAWVASLRDTKFMLLLIYEQFWVRHRMMLLVVLLFFMLPLSALWVRFGYDGTKNKSELDRSLIWIFRMLGAGLMLVCIWLAFDPTFGLRQLIDRQTNVALPLLTFDYLNALGIGFLAGNLLLAIQPGDETSRHKRSRLPVAWLERAAIPGLTVLLVIVALGLWVQNLPAILLVNREPLTKFGELVLHSLPPGGGIVVSDSPDKLEVFLAAQAMGPDPHRWVPLDMSALSRPEYRARLKKLVAAGTSASTNTTKFETSDIWLFMDRLTRSNRVFYLHPSYGGCFELFYAQPVGVAYELKHYPVGAINSPALSPEAIAQNEQAWDKLAPEIQSLQSLDSAAASSWFKPVKRMLRLETALPGQIRLLKDWYSLGLNDWGVQLQRNGRLPAAERRFVQAQLLNTNNWIARLNLYCNTNLQSGTNRMSLVGVGSLEAQLGSAQKRALSMSWLGPLDEPDGCFILGKDYQQQGWLRLAMQEFERARALTPGVLAPEFALAELYGRCGLTNQATTTLDQLRREINLLPEHGGFEAQLALLEAGVWLAQTNFYRASLVLHQAAQQHPEDTAMLNQISRTYFAFGDFTNAEELTARQLATEPDNISALLVQSGILMQNHRADLAIPILNHILVLTNNFHVKLIRAVAEVETTNYAAAQADYHDLETSLPNVFQAEFGLAQIAELEHDTNGAIHYLKRCLANPPSDSVLAQKIRDRLHTLQAVKSGT